MEIGNHRRTRNRASRCCKGRTKKNVVKNHVLVHSGIKSNTLRAGYKDLPQKPRTCEGETRRCKGGRKHCRRSFLAPWRRKITGEGTTHDGTGGFGG
jgi:hypothetical protein